MLALLSWITNTWWRLVFWWKKRTGWLDLHEQIEVTGTIVDMVLPGVDGDRDFNVRLDPGFEKYITGFGGRLTTENDAVGPSLHCEIEPWASAELKATYAQLTVGARVRVRGAWGFDGVHLGVSMWLEIPAALIRHQPNVREGWFEIHPVAVIEILDAVSKTQA